ncbi:MAG: hypothetical protein EOM34_02870 [Clostridia bacterium]|nr:hypothetical protein [Clostridia bacterium]NCD01808.1 hypothetical protein [Clostridia bacterium]
MAVIATIALAVGCTQLSSTKPEPAGNVQASSEQAESRTAEDLYFDACDDAMKADEDEIEPLITITKDSDDVIWNESDDKVLMLTFHRYPDSYPDGSDVNLEWGQVWVTSAKEMQDWYKENQDGVDNWTLRLEELIGLPFYGEYTSMTAMWVKPEDMFRPAYQTDITKDEMASTFEDIDEESFDQEYKAWFDDNIISSYFDSSAPWTRLGYTYDWADNGTEKGLCEFIVNQDSTVTIEFTKDTGDFIKWLDEN